MKRGGILHGELAKLLADLGHTDRFLVVDSGFPIPEGVPVVDLRVVYGLPGFEPVLRAILDDVVVEAVLLAEELPGANPVIDAVIREIVDAPRASTSHAELKQSASEARFAVRTAEDTPYANVLLTAGVGFPI